MYVYHGPFVTYLDYVMGLRASVLRLTPVSGLTVGHAVSTQSTPAAVLSPLLLKLVMPGMSTFGGLDTGAPQSV